MINYYTKNIVLLLSMQLHVHCSIFIGLIFESWIDTKAKCRHLKD